MFNSILLNDDLFTNQLNYENNFIDWFQIHQEQEKLATNVCDYMKINLIPTFVQLIRACENFSNKKDEIADFTEIKNLNNSLTQSLEVFNKRFSSLIKLTPLIDFTNYTLDGLNCREDFNSKKWMKIFNICELTSIKILYSMISFLNNNSFISSNIPIKEHNESTDYFLNKNLEFSINDNYKQINYLLMKDKYRFLLKQPFKRIVKFFIKIICKLSPTPEFINKPLKNTISDLLFNLFKKEIQINSFENENKKTKFILTNQINEQKKNLNQTFFKTKANLINILEQKNQINKNDLTQNISNSIKENRSYIIMDEARVSVAEFCLTALKALTGTLFHFWVLKEPLTDNDIDELKIYDEIFKGLKDDVYSALHKYTLFTDLRMRPYGFIMNSILIDNLPKQFWKQKISKKIRYWLQECIAMLINWNFKFLTIYPRPLQAQFSKLSQMSDLYQSMILSLIDFKVILVLANSINNQIKQCLDENKKKLNNDENLIINSKILEKILNTDNYLLKTLIMHLENNFVCKETDLNIKSSSILKLFPSLLNNFEEKRIDSAV